MQRDTCNISNLFLHSLDPEHVNPSLTNVVVVVAGATVVVAAGAAVVAAGAVGAAAAYVDLPDLYPSASRERATPVRRTAVLPMA